MRPRLGIAHSNQPAKHGYGGVCSVGAFIAFGEVSNYHVKFEQTTVSCLSKDWTQLVTEEERVRILLVADVPLPNHVFLLIISE